MEQTWRWFGDIVGLVQLLVAEERCRVMSPERMYSIALRPDHGAVLEGDIDALPGYSWLGWLRGLSELRGVVRAVERLIP